MRLLASAAFVCLSLSGCAGFWDEVTSREFKVKNLFVKQDPLVVLKTSTDGDARARALRSLREPLAHGGSAQDQETVFNLLKVSATSDHQPLCRLAAIRSLGQFKDPRAVVVLKDAFYQANAFPRGVNIPPETVTRIQCEALTSLGETHSPAAVELLVRAVKQPPAEGVEQDRQQTLDVRDAAARALGNFSQYQSTEALIQVLRDEKDVGLRDCAHEALQEATGKELPPDAKAWDGLIHQAGYQKDPREENKLSKLFRSSD